MSSTSSDDGGPRATPYLICRCVAVRSLYVRMCLYVVQAAEIMKELMDNGPLQGKFVSVFLVYPERKISICIRLYITERGTF